MHSQMGFQLHQSHSLTVTGLKGGKKSKYWVIVGKICEKCNLKGLRDLDVAFKLKLQT